MDMGPETQFGIFIGAHDAGLGLAQRRQYFLRVVADGRDDAHPGDDHAFHVTCLVRLNCQTPFD